MDDGERERMLAGAPGRNGRRTYRVPLSLEPQPEGGYTVTSPVLPELITEGDTVEEALAHAREAFALVLDIYEDEGRPLSPQVTQNVEGATISTEHLIELAL